MTEERIFNILKAFLTGDTSYDRLEGILAAFADWHLVKTLYEVKIKKMNKFRFHILNFVEKVCWQWLMAILLFTL